jgi:site-specific recombinase XerD
MKDYAKYSPPQVLLDFLSYMQTIKGKSDSTVQVYFYDIRLFLRFILAHYGIADKLQPFDSIDISKADAGLLRRTSLSDLYAFMSFINRDRDNSSYARARKVAALKSFYSYLFAKAKLLDANPAAELESPKIVKRLPRYLNVDESERLLASAAEFGSEHRQRNYAIVTLFLNCGLRLSELVGVNISNVRGDTLTVIGKGDKERVVYLNGACVDAIAGYMAVRPANAVRDRDALFLSKQRRRISRNMVQRIVKRHIGLAGLDTSKYSTHKLRHTAATLMYQHGRVDIRALQEILGHESIATTEIYTHLDSRQLKDAVDSNPLSGFRAGGSGGEGKDEGRGEGGGEIGAQTIMEELSGL